MTRLTMQQAIVAAIRDEMRADKDVFTLGEDVGKFGGTLRSNAGLFEEFGGSRVIDTPISEGTVAGLAVGAAMQGKRPIMDLMFGEFLALVMQQLLDAGAMHYYSGGSQGVPMVIRARYGIGPFHGHAYDHHSWLLGVPGIKILVPSNPADAYTLMRAAIRDPNPVLFMEHMALYHAGKAEVTEEASSIPVRGSVVAREGKDVTLIGSALMIKRALRAAETLSKAGVSAEVIDVRSIYPLDFEPIRNSLAKTGRVVLLSEAIGRGASINDIAAQISEHAFSDLKAPIVRVTPPDIPTPFARELESIYLPDETRIRDAVLQVIGAGNS